MKAILVLNEMPEICIDCPCSFFERNNTELNLICSPTQEDVNRGGKPDWCPLKPMPVKKETPDNILGVFMNIGRNACIDEILGDKE